MRCRRWRERRRERRREGERGEGKYTLIALIQGKAATVHDFLWTKFLWANFHSFVSWNVAPFSLSLPLSLSLSLSFPPLLKAHEFPSILRIYSSHWWFSRHGPQSVPMDGSNIGEEIRREIVSVRRHSSLTKGRDDGCALFE